MDFLELAERLDRFELVSVDIFDTIIARGIQHPTDLFRVMARTGSHLVRADIADFQAVRVAAEHIQRKLARGRGDEEITLDQIYAEIGRKYELDDGEIAVLKKHETELEIELSAITAFGLALMNYAENSGANLILASDMYLPRAVIDEMLIRNGFSGFSELFLSCEVNRTKHSGSMFDYILEQKGLRPEQMVHIGDNYPIDIAQARKRGIATWHVPPARSAFDDRDLWKKSTLFRTDALTKNHLNALYMLSRDVAAPFDVGAVNRNENLYYHALGHLVLAPVLVELCTWLKRECVEREIEHISFLSRDGFVVKEVFDRMFGGHGISTNYTFASRRMLTLPFVVLTADEIQNYFWTIDRSAATARDLLDGIPGSHLLRHRMQELSVDLDAPFHGRRRADILRLIGENAGLVCLGLLDERDAVKSYLRAQFPATGRFAIFDVGWRGSLQLAMTKAVPDLADRMHGLYFGTSENAATNLSGTGSSYSSFAMEDGRPEEWRHVCQTHTDVIEFLLSADHPSVETVIEKNGMFVPKYQPSSAAERSSQDIAAMVQSAALEAVDRALSASGLAALELLSDRTGALEDFFAFLNRPNKVDAAHLGPVRIFSGIGDLDGVPLIDIGTRYGIFRRRRDSRWPSAFLQNISGWHKLLLFTFSPRWWAAALNRISSRLWSEYRRGNRS